MEKAQVVAAGHQAPTPDFEELSRNMAQLVEEVGKAAVAYVRPMEERRAKPALAEDVGDMVRTFGQVAEHWLTDPQKAIQAQSQLGVKFMDLWVSTLKRMQGEEPKPVAQPEPKDNRVRDPEWSENPVFDFLRSDPRYVEWETKLPWRHALAVGDTT